MHVKNVSRLCNFCRPVVSTVSTLFSIARQDKGGQGRECRGKKQRLLLHLSYYNGVQ